MNIKHKFIHTTGRSLLSHAGLCLFRTDTLRVGGVIVQQFFVGHWRDLSPGLPPGRAERLPFISTLLLVFFVAAVGASGR